MRILSVWLLLALAGIPGAVAQVSATIDIDTTHTTPLHASFSGFNDEVVFPAEFFDYRLNNVAAQLSPGWVRYPSGSFSSAFSWQTGLMVPTWASQFQGTPIASLVAEGVPWVNGKGGGSFVDAANRADFLGANLIVCVNAFTDTPQSAGQMAAFAKANHIPVAVWELANEPYVTGAAFFSSGADYVAKMKPFRDAIKAADPNATVAIFYIDAGDTNPNPAWNQSIANYPDKYWDAVTYHQYPAQSTGAFSQWMADENAVLASKTSAYVSGYLATVNPPGTKFLISEFLPSNDGMGTGTSLTDGTLYGAIYAAEYVMRMSTVPSMLYVGMHALTGTRGVNAVNTHYNDVQSAYNQGTTINTLTLSFGFYLEAQPLGLAVLNGVLKNATQSDAATVTGGATVPATGLGAISALYAEAYTTAAGQQSVVITNKSATSHQVTIRTNGTPVSGTLPVQYIAGSDPSAQNIAANQTAVSVQISTTTNPVTVPAYSVVRVDLNSPAVVSVVSSASYAAGPVAPQEIVTLFGAGIASQTTTVQITDSAGNSQPAQIFTASAGQANVLMPAGLATGPAKVAVLHGSAVALTGSVTIASSQPGLFSINQDGAGAAAADAFLVTAASQRVNQTLFTCNPPAARSCLPAPLSLGGAADTLYVELYGTGIRGAASVQCFVGGQSVPVLYAGQTPGYAGLDQVDISIPKTLAGAGDVRVYLVADGAVSNVVVLKIQ
ncbi:exported hypothetical protein [Candidatus Sulfopaludibacter sp. SbA3]|nr:exported hypothetical protein [Candidatus Sulfopaludibacter sp. SbA3]